MKKILRFFTYSFLGLIGVMIGHLFYLYHHREFGPADFRHPSILALKGQTTEEMKQEASQLLNQRFSYLGNGSQVTAFESEDHRYVIKFFNPRNAIKESWFHKACRLREMSSLEWILKTHFQKEKRLLKLFKCQQMAFQDLREESGLIYLHLDQSSRLSKTLEVVDKEGRSHLMNLDECPFVLQKKVEIARPYLDRQIKNGDLEGARQGVREIYQLFLSRAQKGYTDHRQNIGKNYGFVDGRAVQLDVGRIRKDERVQQLPLKEMEKIVSYISRLLPPQLVPVLDECLETSKQSF